MKIETSELTGPALDWMVAECKKVRTYVRPYEHTMTGLCILDADLVDMETDDAQELRYSRDWAQGGPIIDSEDIDIIRVGVNNFRGRIEGGNPTSGYGPTKLIAAMRCYLASKLGREVEVPDELL